MSQWFDASIGGVISLGRKETDCEAEGKRGSVVIKSVKLLTVVVLAMVA